MKPWLGAVALMACMAAQAQTGAGVSQFTLANGLSVIVKPDRRAPTAGHMLWVRVGSSDEVDLVASGEDRLEREASTLRKQLLAPLGRPPGRIEHRARRVPVAKPLQRDLVGIGGG